MENKPGSSLNRWLIGLTSVIIFVEHLTKIDDFTSSIPSPLYQSNNTLSLTKAIITPAVNFLIAQKMTSRPSILACQ